MDTQRLLTVGKELIKGDFGRALKSLSPYSWDVSPISYRPSIGTGDTPHFFETNGSTYFYFTWSGHNSSQRAYERCPPLNAIINRKAQAYINGKTFVLNTQGKAKGKEATSADAKKLQTLFKRPNPLQSWKQFEAQGYIYQQAFGFNILLPIKPVGFKENIDASSLWNIPPSMIDIEETNKLFYQSNVSGIIKKIVLNYKGIRTELNVDDIYIMKDFVPSFCSLVIPESRVKALEYPINNIMGAYESRNVLINYRGALGILSQDPGNGQYGAIPMTDDQKTALQNDFRRYGLSKHQWQFIITSASLKWQQMGVATKDLMLFEEVDAGIEAICDAYNYPYQLMSSAKGTTFSNLNEGKKLLYQDATLPEAESTYEQWNQFFNTDAYQLVIEKDYSHVAILQEDQVQAAQARKARNDALLIEWQNDLITRNRWLELNGEDPLPDGGDLYYSEWKKLNTDNQNQNTNETGNQQGQGNEAVQPAA